MDVSVDVICEQIERMHLGFQVYFFVPMSMNAAFTKKIKNKEF
ncbi:hypothetical protein [Clostridioides sp. ZZV15-6598]